MDKKPGISRVPILLTSILLGAAPCIWDKDTLGDELRGLPDAFDLVTGRWFVHSEAYYRQRISRLPKHLRAHPEDLAAYDDLAVAYERMRDRRAAIAVMEEKAVALSRTPDKEQQYRYHANLGTFHAHGGQFDEALAQLEKAVAINPAAHFGRERFQINLIGYIAAARKDPQLWSKHNFLTWSEYRLKEHRWSVYVAKTSFTFREDVLEDRAAFASVKVEDAYTAVAGMLRFGGLEGSELFRTAGDLFLIQRHLNLAWWSYQRAIERGHPAKKSLLEAIKAIEKHWREAKKTVGGRVPKPSIEQYRLVRKEAKAWRAAFVAAEETALVRGEDTSATKVLEKLVDEADKAVPRRVVPVKGKTRVRPRPAVPHSDRRG